MSEPGRILQRVRAAAADASLDPEPEPEPKSKPEPEFEPEPEPDPEHVGRAQAQLAGSGSSDAGMRQMLEFQAQRIVQLEAEKRQLAQEVESLRRVPAAWTQSSRAQEGVPPDQLVASARTATDHGDGAALVARGQKQIAELKELLQRSLAQLDKQTLPARPATMVP